MEFNGLGRCFVIDLWYEGFSMIIIFWLENMLLEYFYRILIFEVLIKEDVEDLKEGVIEI